MPISLATNVTAFLTAVKNGLSADRDAGSSVNVPPSYNHLRAQDLANVLRLLQTPLASGVLTATGAGSTTTFVDGASTFVANTQVGNTVTFGAATTTVALRGLTRVIKSNTTTTLTFTEPLPAATATGDTLTISGTLVSHVIDAIMQGKDPFTATPPGNQFGSVVLAHAGLTHLITQLGGTLPRQTMFTSTALAGTDTINITVNTFGTNLKIDALKGFSVTVDGVLRKVVKNTENVITLDKAVTAPAGGEAVVVFSSDTDLTPSRSLQGYPGGHAGENYRLAALIQAAQSAVEAFTVPA